MKRIWRTGCFWAAALLIQETAIHIQVTGGLSARFLWALPFTLSLAAFFAVLSHMFKSPAANRAVRLVLLAAVTLVFCVQTVYFKIFKGLLSLSYVEMGGDAIAGFFSVTVDGILRSLPVLVLLLLPVPALILLERFKVLSRGQESFETELVTFCVSVLLFALGVPQEGSGSARSSVYYGATSTMERHTDWFGLLTAERLEVERIISGSSEHESGGIIMPSDDPGFSQDGTGTPGDEPEDLSERYNVIPGLDFDLLAEKADSTQKKELSQYFAAKRPAAKNEYTGMMEGYNVIEICAESYSPYLVDEERTPALYRLTHEGFVFDNFYCSFAGLTSNGEYALCMGLMPDRMRHSFTFSSDNYVPFTLPNRLSGQGVTAKAYHNYVADFYGRLRSHPNMGYDFKAINGGLELEYPYLDTDLVKVSMEEYIDAPRFVVHYMTFSGHVPYERESAVVQKHLDEVIDMDVPEDLQGYYACNMELELAVEYMLQKLEEKGIADKTLIILTGDHYPYGLAEESMEALAGDAAGSEPFWKYRNSFVCWSGSIKEPIHVEDYCCTQDILPTVLNLLGVPYDSRLLTGVDVLSDSQHMAVLFDGSFITDEILYDSSTGEITWKVPESELPAGRGESLSRYAENVFNVGSAVLRTDYYRFAFETCGIGGEIDDASGYAFLDFRGAWYEDAVTHMLELNLINGSNLKFMGDDPIERGQIITIISRMLALEDDGSPDPPYVDMEKSRYYYYPIKLMWAAGLIPDGDLIRPNDHATWPEVRELLVSSAAYLEIPDPESWADELIDSAKANIAADGADPEIPSRGAVTAALEALSGYVRVGEDEDIELGESTDSETNS